jgi:hypothetical protein
MSPEQVTGGWDDLTMVLTPNTSRERLEGHAIEPLKASSASR